MTLTCVYVDFQDAFPLSLAASLALALASLPLATPEQAIALALAPPVATVALATQAPHQVPHTLIMM